MPNSPLPTPGSPNPKSASLPDRVSARVASASAAIDRLAGVPGESQDSSMRMVFRQMGRSYRQHRRQTGERVNPAVRNAALAFKGEPSLAALTEVAARLEQEGILNW